MKIAFCSDLHLEFGKLEMSNTENADVLVLAGDICVANDVWPLDDPLGMGFGKSDRIHDFFQNVCDEFPEVIYICGNHEHYHGDYKYSLSRLRDNLGYIPNLRILEKESYNINGITFVCGTMWSDFNGGDPGTLAYINWAMNDFRIVKNSLDRKPVNTMDGEVMITNNLTPEFAWSEHIKFVDYLEKKAKSSDRVVVVSHHGPSMKSIHPKYAGDSQMNGGYCSDLEDVLEQNQNIELWIHGHVHSLFDYVVHNTRVVTNPRGYINYEAIADNFELKYIEI